MPASPGLTRRLLDLATGVHTRIGVTRTLHALPFAAAGGVMAGSPWPQAGTLVLLLLCALFGRATLVSLLRMFQAPPDVANAPITTGRTPAAPPPPPVIWMAFAAHAALLLVLCAFLLNDVTGWLSLPYTALLLLYAGTRRWTGVSHFLLGLGLGASPLAIWVALEGTLHGAWPALGVLGAGITLWAAGFDMVYSLQHELHEPGGPDHFARRMALSEPAVLRLARACHLLAALLFAAAGWLHGLQPAHLVGPGMVAVLLCLAHRSLPALPLSAPPAAFVRINLLTGPALLLGLLLGS